jgi:hypothetical protein
VVGGRAGGGVVAVAEVLGQVLGEVADAPGGVLAPGQDALGVELRPEPRDVQRLVLWADGIQGLIPRRQELAGHRVEVAAGRLMPDRQVPVVVVHGIGLGPPDLVIGRGENLAQLSAGHGSADRHVNVRGQPFLRLDNGEVLQVVADQAAQVLDQAVEQRGEVQRVAGGSLVAVAGRVSRDAVSRDFAVAVAGRAWPTWSARAGNVRLHVQPGRDAVSPGASMMTPAAAASGAAVIARG